MKTIKFKKNFYRIIQIKKKYIKAKIFNFNKFQNKINSKI